MEEQRMPRRNRSWSEEEDNKLRREVTAKPKQKWCSVARNAGLNRSANSCRTRWVNHLKPGFRPGKLTDEEKVLILVFHSQMGKNCWAKIAAHLLPGRTDNDVKNFWHTLAKRAKLGNCDVEGAALLQKEELVNKITAAGKLTMDYLSLISDDACTILNRLLPDLAVAGGSPATAAAESSLTAADTAMEVGHEFPNPVGDSHMFPDNEPVHWYTGDWFVDYYKGDEGGSS